MNEEDLQRYADGWNEHDIEKIMQYMTDDCIFETGGGSERYGTRYQGYEEVKSRFIEVWVELPDVRFENPRHFIQGNRGCTEWTFMATKSDGTKIEIDGCDIFEFAGDKIRVKNSFVKNRK